MTTDLPSRCRTPTSSMLTPSVPHVEIPDETLVSNVITVS